MEDLLAPRNATLPPVRVWWSTVVNHQITSEEDTGRVELISGRKHRHEEKLRLTIDSHTVTDSNNDGALDIVLLRSAGLHSLCRHP